MNNERLKNTEVSFDRAEGRSGARDPLSLEHVNHVFLREKEMLSSIASYLSPETKEAILEKIDRQNEILVGIVDEESRIREKADEEKGLEIDAHYFSKKPLNLNNI